MPRKKPGTSKSSEPKQPPAPDVPKTPRNQPKAASLPDSDTTAERITVRTTSSKGPVEQETESTLPPAYNLDNLETDKAVDDIMAKESDIVLAVDDIMAEKRSQDIPTSGWKEKLLSIIRNKWTWVGIVVILGILFGVPATRYKLLGLVIKKEVHITVIDSQNDTPVSNALVSLAGVSVKTGANGTAELRARVGEQTLVITKQYYRTTDVRYFVGFKGSSLPIVRLVATGRLVPITIDNIISGKPVPNVIVRVLKTTVKTNSKGQANIALPSAALSDNASISLAGYNTKQVSVQVTAKAVPANNFTLTPSGAVYFLSNQSGTIDVVKSNLDGSGRQTVLVGSGDEVAATTRLIASRDWHYLVLEANRSGGGAALYLINTANNQVSEFDSSDASFNLIGWYGHNFIYSLTSNNKNQWQAGSEVIKEYNADQAELNQLDQNLAVGDSTSYAYQDFSNFYIAGGALVYDNQWKTQGGYDLTNENDTIRVFQFNSQVLKDYESFPAISTVSINANLYQPQAIYFAVLSSTDNTTSYYQYDNQNVQTATINQTIFNQSSPSYVLSPSGSYTVWSELSNGQDLFLKGNSNAGSQKQIAALDGYSPYGWYSDSYVLASSGNDQLSVLPASGLSGTQQPLKITAYYEPSASSNYEYGGF